MPRTLADMTPGLIAESLDYMERKALRRTSRGKRSPYEDMWRLRELGLTETGSGPHLDALTDLGRETLDALKVDSDGSSHS